MIFHVRTSLPRRWLFIAYLISHQVSYQEGEVPLEVAVDEDPEPSLVSIQRWRDSQEASSSQVLTGDGSISKRAAKDTSQRSEAKTDGQRDRSSRLGTALFMSLGCGGGAIAQFIAFKSGNKLPIISKVWYLRIHCLMQRCN